MIKSSATGKSSAQPTSQRARQNRNAAIVSPEGNSYDSEYEDYDDSDDSASQSQTK